MPGFEVMTEGQPPLWFATRDQAEGLADTLAHRGRIDASVRRANDGEAVYEGRWSLVQ